MLKYKSRIITALIVVGVVTVGVILSSVGNESFKKGGKDNIDIIPPIIDNTNQIEGNKDDLVSFSVWPNSKVSGVLEYKGEVKGGYFFEANILVNVLDMNKFPLLKSNATATTEWMTVEAVAFEGNIDFTNLPKGPANIEIHNDNASGLPVNDKNILIPIVIE